jgi:hypothetical protein
VNSSISALSSSLVACIWVYLLFANVCPGGSAHNPQTVKIYTRTEVQAIPNLESVPSVSQYGITWTFDKPTPVGRFVNGDFYVVGPVQVVAIDPKPLAGAAVPEAELSKREKQEVKGGRYVRNGSMINPPPRWEVAFDSGMKNCFRPDLLAVPPVTLNPGDSLVSTISLKVGEKSAFPYHGSGAYREHHDDSPVKTAAVLTCVKEAQPPDAFRPSYGDREQKIYFARDLRRDLLPRLPRPSEAPDLALWTRIFQRPWINTCFFGYEQPMENMPHYGQWVGQAQSIAGLLLMLDFDASQKEPLLLNVVQVGIDYWGLVRNGHPGWQGWGGHGSGRKFPIVLAGLLLGDEQMAAPTRTFPKVEFGEDNQTMYGNGWTGAKALFAGHSGVQRASGKVERPKWGPYEHLPPSQWSQGNYNSECYRRANTSSSWVGEALVLRLLRAEKYWNHDPFFDYVDRWMTEDDREHRREITKHWPESPLKEKDTWAHQGNTRDPFVKVMWTKYRHRPTASVR